MSFVPTYKLTDAKYLYARKWLTSTCGAYDNESRKRQSEAKLRRRHVTCTTNTFIRANNVPNNWPTDDHTFGMVGAEASKTMHRNTRQEALLSQRRQRVDRAQ